jgi:hypothetical protein
MDLLRHVGRGNLTSFAGGSAGNQALEQSVWRNAPYTEADLAAQVNTLRNSGSRGAQLYDDITQYIQGVNAYITHCMTSFPINCPGEYVLTGHLDAITGAGGPVPFTITDVVAISGSWVGSSAVAAARRCSRPSYASRPRPSTARPGRPGVAGVPGAERPGDRADPPQRTELPVRAGARLADGVVLPDRGTATPQPVVFNRSGSAQQLQLSPATRACPTRWFSRAR